MRGITRDTVVELFDRKVIYIYAVVTVLTLLILILMRMVETRLGGEFDIATDDIGQLTAMLGEPLIHMLAGFMSFLVFLTVLATAGLAPNMLMKGRADYYLSKPISRSAVFVDKLLSIWLVYGGIVVVCGIVAVLMTYLVHGFFAWSVLYIFILKVVILFIWLSITVSVGVITGSATISIMAAFIVYVLEWLLEYREFVAGLSNSRVVEFIINALYYVLPKAGEISDLTTRLALDRRIDTWMPLWSSLLFSAALIYVAIFIFRRKDY
ncbi:MAG: hypothetical protein OEW00_12455 [candidate division Zixibacteria bacterium]|nr:hypothetical protein [candidate division Zixibacteria bacterium]